MKRLRLLARGSAPQLPDLAPERARAVQDDFRDRVTGLSLLNADNPAWWHSWLSSRDQYHCSLAADLAFLARAEDWLASQGDGARLCCPDPILAEALARRAEVSGWTVERPRSLRFGWVKDLADAAKALAVGWLNVRAARRHPQPALGGYDTILVAWHDKRLTGQRGPFESTYFGRLGAMLEQAGERCLHFGPVMAAPTQIGELTGAAVAVADARLATIGHALTYGDVVAAVFGALTGRVVIPSSDRALLAKGLFRRVLYDAQARMIGRATARILALNPGARIIHIYENLPWERAVDAAARAAGRSVTGYLHCAVLPSHLNYFVDEREAAIRPAPDRIVCTGPAAREVLLGLGCHDPARVLPGMALRGPDPASIILRTHRPRRIATVLVLLEGLFKMVPLLKVLAETEGLRLLVRAHPMLPLETLAQAAGVPCGPGTRLEKSAAATLEDAIAEADAVLYQGTTAVLSAALMGVPLIRFDAGLPRTDDPLLRCTALKRDFSTADGMAAAVRSLETLTDAEWACERDALRTYAANYVRAPSAEALADFRVAHSPAPRAE